MLYEFRRGRTCDVLDSKLVVGKTSSKLYARRIIHRITPFISTSVKWVCLRLVSNIIQCER